MMAITVSGVRTSTSRLSTSAKPRYSAFSGPKKTRCIVQSMYPAVRITPKQEMIASVMMYGYAAPWLQVMRIESRFAAWKLPSSTITSPMNPHNPGRPRLAKKPMVENAQYCGMVVANPPKRAISR